MRGDKPASKDTVDGIAGQRDATKAGYNAGFAKLSAVSGLPGTAELLAKLKAAEDAVEAMRPTMMAQIALPQAQRTMVNVVEWANISQDYITAVKATSAFLEPSQQLVDPTAADA